MARRLPGLNRGVAGASQRRFLAARSNWGTINKAVKQSDLYRYQVDDWMKANVAFRRYVRLARADFRDSLLDPVVDRVLNPCEAADAPAAGIPSTSGGQPNKGPRTQPNGKNTRHCSAFSGGNPR
ncbi:MAG: hypothetical protein HY261_01010 [Chloroflexi bacterium]|nr:hypothetical protein [Chloroflexota bacterium]